MPTYRFNVHDGRSPPDVEGHRLPDIAAAQREAVMLAGRLIRENADAFWATREWRMEVTDERGLMLFDLMFVGSLAPALQREPLPGARAVRGWDRPERPAGDGEERPATLPGGR